MADDPRYRYSASVLKVVDADTLHLRVSLGHNVMRDDTYRLSGINAPEKNTAAGVEAIRYLTAWLAQHASLDVDGRRRVLVTTIRDQREKFGRYVAEIRPLAAPDAPSLNADLIAAGHAVPYDGGRR